MVKEIEKTGQNNICDNFFRIFFICKTASEQKLNNCLHYEKNKPELLLEFAKSRRRKVASTLFCFQKEAMITLHVPKKNAVVNMLSTLHSQPYVAAKSVRKKPEITLFESSGSQSGRYRPLGGEKDTIGGDSAFSKS